MSQTVVKKRFWDTLIGGMVGCLKSPDGTTLCVAVKTITMRCWDIGTGKCLKTLQDILVGSDLRFSPRKGDILASGDGVIP